MAPPRRGLTWCQLGSNSRSRARVVNIFHRPGGRTAPAHRALQTNCCSTAAALGIRAFWDRHVREFAELLASRGAGVLLLDLLTEGTITQREAARMQGVAAAVDTAAGTAAGAEASTYLQSRPRRVGACDGRRPITPPTKAPGHADRVVGAYAGGDFVIEPLPNLVFTATRRYGSGRGW